MSSVTCACCGQKAVPGSVIGGGGRGGSLAGRAPSARHLCGARGVWAEPSSLRLQWGSHWPALGAARQRCLAGGARSPSGGTFLGPWPGQLGRAGADERFWELRGRDEGGSACSSSACPLPLLGGLWTQASAHTDPSHQALFSVETRVSPLQGGDGGCPREADRVGALGARLITAPSHRA